MQRANDKPCSVKLHDMLVLDSSNCNSYLFILVFFHAKYFLAQKNQECKLKNIAHELLHIIM